MQENRITTSQARLVKPYKLVLKYRSLINPELHRSSTRATQQQRKMHHLLPHLLIQFYHNNLKGTYVNHLAIVKLASFWHCDASLLSLKFADLDKDPLTGDTLFVPEFDIQNVGIMTLTINPCQTKVTTTSSLTFTKYWQSFGIVVILRRSSKTSWSKSFWWKGREYSLLQGFQTLSR
jgi:hypothetical protein